MSKSNSRKKEKLNQISKNIQFIAKEEKLLNFNFKYYAHEENNGQSFEDWNRSGILTEFNNKLVVFSGKSKIQLIQDKKLRIYGKYIENSKFSCPQSLKGQEIEWARFRLTGRRRLIGFFVKNDSNFSNTFYVVFLDKNHEFAPVDKK